MWINEELLDRKEREKMRAEFVRNRPFPHLLVENFLEEGKAKELAVALKKEAFEEKDSDLFQFRQTGDLEHSKQKAIKVFYDMMSSGEFGKIIKDVTGIQVSGRIDMAGSLYISTDYLLCHDDELEDRKIAYVYYLCDDFGEEDGGALALLADNKGKPGEVEKKYYPKWNSLILFEVSARSWHEVEEVIKDGKERYAIGGWLH